MNVIGYVRVSTQGQAIDGYSLIEIDLDWLHASQGFFFWGSVTNELFYSTNRYSRVVHHDVHL
jgi:DNA invertase Pin-like site-specific DNA recombinase